MGQGGQTVEVEAGVQGHPLYIPAWATQDPVSAKQNNSNESVQLVEFVTEVPGTKEMSLDLGPLEEQGAA